jgi:hypothetical protein
MMFGYVRRVVAGRRAWWAAEGRAEWTNRAVWRIAIPAALAQAAIVAGAMVWVAGPARVVTGSASPVAPPAVQRDRALPAPMGSSTGPTPVPGTYRIPAPTWHQVPWQAPGWHELYTQLTAPGRPWVIAEYRAIETHGDCAMFPGGSDAPINMPGVDPAPYPAIILCGGRSMMVGSVEFDRWAWAAASGDPQLFRVPPPWCQVTGRHIAGDSSMTLDCSASGQGMVRVSPEAEAMVLDVVYQDSRDRVQAR